MPPLLPLIATVKLMPKLVETDGWTTYEFVGITIDGSVIVLKAIDVQLPVADKFSVDDVRRIGQVLDEYDVPLQDSMPEAFFIPEEFRPLPPRRKDIIRDAYYERRTSLAEAAVLESRNGGGRSKGHLKPRRLRDDNPGVEQSVRPECDVGGEEVTG